MTPSLTQATTRQAPGGRVPPRADRHLFVPGQVLSSPETPQRYEIKHLVGHGGFGQVYLARRLGRSTKIPQEICIKVSTRIDGWMREAHFGSILEGEGRAIRLYDRFPLVRADGQILYCLALEYATGGDLSAFLFRTNKGWPEASVRREIAGVLGVLGKLHRGHLLHRDLTPLNVFVCAGSRLKLGDFGIVRHLANKAGINARTFNPFLAPKEIFSGAVPKWQARDDVYQIGQLVGMLVKGDARQRVSTSDVRRMACSDDLKEIIYRCIGQRSRRYQNADELVAALNTRPALLRSGGGLRTLRGVHLAFTGILKMKRAEAMRAARRAGARVHRAPSVKTTVVVRGRPNPLQAAGKEGGRKLLEIKRLMHKGHKIKLVSESQFLRLLAKA